VPAGEVPPSPGGSRQTSAPDGGKTSGRQLAGIGSAMFTTALMVLVEAELVPREALSRQRSAARLVPSTGFDQIGRPLATVALVPDPGSWSSLRCNPSSVPGLVDPGGLDSPARV